MAGLKAALACVTAQLIEPQQIATKLMPQICMLFIDPTHDIRDVYIYLIYLILCILYYDILYYIILYYIILYFIILYISLIYLRLCILFIVCNNLLYNICMSIYIIKCVYIHF